MKRYVIYLAAVLLTPASASAEAFRMLMNNGVDWTPVGDYATLKECESEARTYATKRAVQTACAPVTAWQQYEAQKQRALQQQEAERQSVLKQQANDRKLESTARQCASRSRVEVFVKPGGNVETLGTAKERFDFDKCMASKGISLE
jgi:hypothetical protein